MSLYPRFPSEDTLAAARASWEASSRCSCRCGAGTAKSSHVPNEEPDSLKGLPKLAAQYRNRVDATADFAEAFITRHAQSPFFFVREGRLEPPPRTAEQGPPSLGLLAPRSEVPPEAA